MECHDIQIRHPVCSQMVILAEALWAGKANPCHSYWIFHWEQSPAPSFVNNLPPCGWLISKLGTQCWLLLLAGWALSSGCSQTGLGEWESMLLSPCMTSIPPTMATFFMSPLIITLPTLSLVTKYHYLVPANLGFHHPHWIWGARFNSVNSYHYFWPT